MTRSMTGFATRDGAAEGWSWAWELRAVNGRGLDIRMRLPDWPGDLETPVRAALQKALGRGNVTVSLKLQRDGGNDGAALNAVALARAIELVGLVEQHAVETDIALQPSRATDILAMRGVLESGSDDGDPAPVRQAILADLPALIDAFEEMRATEGAALADIIGKQVDAIASGAKEARALLSDRADHMAAAFRAARDRLVENAEAMDEARITQELAAMAVKADVTEELDRLDAHVAAARALLDGAGPRGRKLDFLTQEFNREANTLCSKAQYAELTRIGLDLKHSIDQMREQVQNVE